MSQNLPMSTNLQKIFQKTKKEEKHIGRHNRILKFQERTFDWLPDT